MHIIYIDTLLLLAVIICTFMVILKRCNNRLNVLSRDIPGPPTIPIIGNGLEVLKNADVMISYFSKLQKKYGEIVKLWLGPNLYVFLSDPDDVEMILKDTQNIKKSNTYTYIKPWLGEGLATSSGQHWHRHRKILTPAFHFNILDKFVDVFNEKGKTLIEILKKKEADGDYFDIYPYINLFAFDAILESSMGMQCNYQEEKENDYLKAIRRMTQIALHRATNVILRPAMIFPFTKMGKEQNKVLDIIHGYARKVIKDKKANLKNLNFEIEKDDTGIKKRHAFLDLLLIKQSKGAGLSDQDICDEVNTFLFGGHDTMTSAMGFVIYYLSRNQHIQEKVYKEVEELFGNDTDHLTLQNLQNCHYIEMVIKEVLRLAPSVPSMSRLLQTDVKLKNHTLPAGTNASIVTFLLHRNPKIYPDPEKFDPERFSIEASRNRHPYAYVPFSAGLRNCIGQKYAMLEMKAFLIKMVSNFRVLPGEDIKEFRFVVTLKSSNGINVKLVARQKSLSI